MASSTTILTFLLSATVLSLMALIAAGGTFANDCSYQDLEVTQEPTGSTVKGKPEYRVDIFNGCPCTQAKVTIDCAGFQTVEDVDPSVLRKDGDLCIVGNGTLIPPLQGTFFSYAWESQFSFKPISSSPDCE